MQSSQAQEQHTGVKNLETSVKFVGNEGDF